MHLESLYSLSNFDKQPPLPKFRAMGDDEGLFVIVPEHRNWYPTHKPSGIFPMIVEFDNRGKSYSLEIKKNYIKPPPGKNCPFKSIDYPF